MTETGDIVQAAAVLRRKFRRIRIQQMQGGHKPGQSLQSQIYGASGHKIGRRGHERKQLGLPSGQNYVAVGVQRHVAGVLQQAAGVRQAENGGQTIFPRHGGQMPGHAAGFADQARGARQQGGPAGIGPLHHQHAALGKGEHVRFLAGHKGRSHAHAGTHRHAAARQNGQAGRQLRGLSVLCPAGNAVGLAQRPALQDHDASVPGFQGPFHILRFVVIFFQRQGHASQPGGLGDGEAERARRVSRMFFEQMRRVFAAEHKNVGRDGSVHHGLGQTRHGIEQHPLLSVGGGHGVTAVSHATGFGAHHSQHSHGHGRRVVRNAALVAVAHGSDRVFTGHDFLPDFAGFFGRHIEFRTVLAGKGHAQSVLAHGAAAQGQKQTVAGPLLHARHGFGNGRLQVWRQRRRQHTLLQGGGQAEHLIQTAHVRGLNTTLQLAAQAVIFHEAVIGGHRYRETIGHIQAHIGGQFAQIGHLAAHLGQVGQAYVGQRPDQRPPRRMFRQGQQALHIPPDALKGLLQRGIAVAGQGVQFTHHLEHGGHGAGAGGAHIIHAEGFGARKAFLHIAHGFQGAFIGRKQPPETRAALTQAGLELLLQGQFGGIRRGRFFSTQPAAQVLQQSHIRQRSGPLPLS